MRTELVACVAAGAVGMASSAGVVAYDGFSNGPRPNLDGSSGGTGWSSTWVDSGSVVATSVGGAGLTYPNLVTTPGAAVTPDAALDFSGAMYGRSFGAVPGNKMYFSFLYHPVGWDGMNAGISFGGYTLFGVPVTTGAYSIRLGHYLFVGTGVNAMADQTVLIVGELEVTGATTVYRMWVNPPVGQPEPAAQAQYALGGATLPQTMYWVNAGSVILDELRIGTTWADVTPTTLGACCVGGALCLSLSQGDCAILAGSTWAGTNTTCAGGCGVPACDSIDFNHDTLFPDTADIDDFLTVFSGGGCSTGACGDIDFNNDGLFPDTADIDAMLRVFSGGACS